MIELSNEPNLNPGWKSRQRIDPRTWRKRLTKRSRTPDCRTSSCSDRLETLRPRSAGCPCTDWCAALVAQGCTTGTCFDWANYHNYGEPMSNENWWHVYTIAPTTDPRNKAGESCQSVFGNPPFAMTEFGEACSWIGGDETKQADYISRWMQAFKGQPQCKLAIQFALADNFTGNGSGYGLRRLGLIAPPLVGFLQGAGNSSAGAANEPNHRALNLCFPFVFHSAWSPGGWKS